MKNLISIPVLAFAVMLQTALVSRITLLSGAADLVLMILITWALQEQVKSSWHWAGLAVIMSAFVSATSPIVLILSYFMAVGFSRYVLRLTWQTPILALFAVTFFSTLFLHIATYFSLYLSGVKMLFGDALALITLPSIFLNLLIALPVHSLIRDLSLWVYPVEDII